MDARRRRGVAAATAVALLALAAACVPGVTALSWPLCDAGGQVWVTERPRTEPTFPGANLWFFCESGLNVLGVSVDPCISNGTVCSDAVPDALCQGLGFDRAWGESAGGEAPRVVNATREEAVRSLTGEYCLRDGLYAPTVPENLTALPGEPCRKLDGITCIRTRATIITALDAANLAAFKPAPPAAEPAVPSEPKVPVAAQQAVEEQAGERNATRPDGGGARRKLLRQDAMVPRRG